MNNYDAETLQFRAPWVETFDRDGHRVHQMVCALPSGDVAEVSIGRSRQGHLQRVTFSWLRPPVEDEDMAALVRLVIPEVIDRANWALVTDRAFDRGPDRIF